MGLSRDDPGTPPLGAEQMAQEFRFVATTYNLWAQYRWPERIEPLRGYLRLARPDVLCVQELRQPSRDLIDEELSAHARVDDPFEGWVNEGNIYWNTTIFEFEEHGAEDIGMLEPARRLFWVRLKTGEHTVLVATAHYTYQGHPRERTEGVSPRLEQARRTVTELERVARADEPLLFMGDLNDTVNAIRILRDAGFRDSFTACGSPLLPTHPARPTADGNPQVLDWQFHRGPIRAMNSHVGGYFGGDIAPSDHKPVVATYAIGERPA
jgi:endonuclease/exonuclease/phosphatase (EEP) superfamily protein YafD